MYRKLIYILLLVVLASCGAGKNLRRAEERMALGEYYDAAKYYRKAYAGIKPKDRSKRGIVAYKMGTCYRLINYNLRAKGAYMNAVRYQCPDSLAIFYLAESLRKNGEYKAAATRYQDYLERSPKDSLALAGLESCSKALEWKENPTRYIVARPKELSSRRSEYAPMYLPADAATLYFTSTRDAATGADLNPITGVKSTDLFVMEKDENGKWKEPIVVEGEVNTEFEDGACCFSPDGKTMYFTRCRTAPDRPVYAEIYSSTRSGATWAKPALCTILNDSLSSVAHPAVSPMGDFLYFTSDMPGGYGGLDIWRINFVADGFGYVDNLGPDVNTAGDEMFPTFGPDGTLYFSSNGHVGMGGLDLFSAVQDSVTELWQVENMGYPLNSQADDFGMTFEPGFKRGYFSSNRGDARGWDHIYSFLLPEVHYSMEGWVYDKEGDPLPDAEVTIVGDDGTYIKTGVKVDGSFTQDLKINNRYVLLASCKGYLNKKQELITDTIQADQSYVLDFPLASITRPVLIENIFYEFDRADLTPASTQALDELIELLADNPNVTIELASHCDYKGNDAYNERLSQRRAESVVRYLIEGGITEDRLTAKGYGESKPKIVTKSVLKQAPFLKLDDELTEEFILTLTPEQQEICNAINRRTEFQVLRTTYGMYQE